MPDTLRPDGLRSAANPAKRVSAKQDGGGGRTRTCEVIRRLIYSQLPLPLGTLPRSTASEPTRRTDGRKVQMMTLKPGADGELPVGVIMGETARQSQPS